MRPSLFPPLINWLGFEEPERSVARLLTSNLSKLKHHVGEFDQAVSLVRYCDVQRAPARATTLNPELTQEGFEAQRINSQFIEWKMLAARAAAITLGNFEETWRVVGGVLSKCPSLKDKQDREPLRKAEKIFRATFPAHSDARDAVAHSGKLFNTVEKAKEHVFPGTNVTVIQMMSGSSVMSSINGSAHVLTVDETSANRLAEVAELVFASFLPIEAFSTTLQTRYTPEEEAAWAEMQRQRSE